MEDSELETHVPHEWVPETSPLRLGVLGKLMEESGELVSAAARCTIQGIDECHPVTGKANREWLEDEIADVLALCGLAVSLFRLDTERIQKRSDRKLEFKQPWWDFLRDLR